MVAHVESTTRRGKRKRCKPIVYEPVTLGTNANKYRRRGCRTVKSKPVNELALDKALAVVRNSGRYVINLVSDDESVTEVSSIDEPMQSDGIPYNQPIQNDNAIGIAATEKRIPTVFMEHPDWVQPLSYGRRCECGMLLLDSDKMYSTATLNLLIRRNNISVLVLRSKSKESKSMDDRAKLGSFSKVLRDDWKCSTYPPATETKIPVQDLQQRLQTKGSTVLTLPHRMWDVKKWSDMKVFADWWRSVVDAIFEDTTWPFHCVQSPAALNFNDEELQSVLCEYEAVARTCVDSAIINMSMALLVGGIGSPPHFDTLKNIASGDVRTALAVGYIIQGIKYFWAVPPKGGYAVHFHQVFPQTVQPTKAEVMYRADLDNGVVPHPFQGEYSLGWPTVSQWVKIGKQIPNHFHEVIANDRYIVTEGSWHCVINHPDYQPVAVAHDDEWVGSQSDLQTLDSKS